MPSSSGSCIKTMISSSWKGRVELKHRKERETDFEKHEIIGFSCNTVLLSNAPANTALAGEASPTGKLRGIH